MTTRPLPARRSRAVLVCLTVALLPHVTLAAGTDRHAAAGEPGSGPAPWRVVDRGP